jgi:hypothetical protein
MKPRDDKNSIITRYLEGPIVQLSKEDLGPWRSKAEKEWLNPEYDYLAWFTGLKVYC